MYFGSFLASSTKPHDSARKLNEPASSPTKPVPQDNSKPVPPNKVSTKEVSQPTNLPARSTAQVNNKPAGNPARSTVSVSIKLAGNAVKTTSTADVNNKPAGLSHLPQDVPVVNSAVPEPPRVESPSATASRISKHITKWSVSEVVDYIRTTDCYRFADDFVRQVGSNF